MRVLTNSAITLFASLSALLTINACLSKINSNQSSTSQLKSVKFTKDFIQRNYQLLKEPNLSLEKQNKVLVNSEKILTLSPINESPFLQLALLEIQKKNYPKARTLLEKAEQRNPRSKHILRALSLINIYEEDFTSAVKNIHTLMTRSKGEQLAEPLSFLSQIFTTPDGYNAIVDILSSGPSWGKAFLQHQIKISNAENIKLLTAPLNNFRNSVVDESLSSELHLKYINRLFTLGYTAEAYNQWLSFPFHKTPPKRGQVFDENFKNELSGSVFSWRERHKPKYFSEIDKNDGLFTSFEDITPRKLTSQFLFLPNDTDYTLSVEFRRNYKDRNGYFNWQITCQSGQLLANINIDDSNTDKNILSANFKIPDTGCDLQEAKLLGHPGKYRARISLTTKNFKVKTIK